MATAQLVPARETRVELRVANSRFIATLAPVKSVEEARSFIERIKAEFDDASHNVPAYIIGHGASVTAHCSDDGEPSGTAGRPALAVLKGSGLGDAAVVVTRYFGGTKLGTGGLVRAYGDAVREVLQTVPKAVKVPTITVMIAIQYSLFEQLRILVQEYGGQILDEVFAADITMVIRFREDNFAVFQTALRELTHGQTEALIVERDSGTIMPIENNGEDES
jgi:uncharacterized YigZ family protein